MEHAKDKQVLLEVNQLSIRFHLKNGKEAKVVDDVSFTIHKGETVALVGESGSGKSITSLAIMRLLPIPPGEITAGTINFNGKNLLAYKNKEMSHIRGNEISMIFQEPMTSLDPVFTIGNQMIEGIRRHQKVSKKDAWQKALQLLKEVGIANAEKVIAEYPHQLSGGMRQRVMIAIAMSNNPQLLIADEPTTALDVTVQAQILKLMMKMKEEHQSAILFITHDMSVVAETADRVMVMYAGQIVEEAPVRELFLNPQHPYTAALLKTMPSLETEVKRLPSIPGTVPPAYALPKGCRFAPRCPHAMAQCHQDSPTIHYIQETHKVRCHLFTEKGELAHDEERSFAGN
ncbi:ABC transporter ATP-binding protein [Lysinibacillus sp. FSL M8-0216]|uniref:Peptide/nickel transport system ATP-binding protein n=1 Tax=Lysinibacillus fusiformis TaxID=28031 RepID=A0A1H8ZA40_9BACI|nr:ABC transporter ATP-binding protein [Lysinibacillus fusiformis]MCG7434696.1 ABC transporter ATP-binding protein [Lysinibacillus fusiformis]NOG28178.1 ABC transporter ATP-binding protein [Lysinibacillus fusiformis]SCX45762.1 peptide/nickel transport system ATP-binding protein [Lysinibacillus fusiformis]SCX91621.1 peptide/nickel transport system ATP-binding protein [Lysinibacillus fusiformis]SDB16673.1 peptide/nickel transport system ATP-binding protein [Lysinibacillus fusiformis]